MANKRDLKRTINYITSELFAETVAASLYNGKPLHLQLPLLGPGEP